MNYFNKEGKILFESTTNTKDFPDVGDLLNFGTSYHQDYWIVISRLYKTTYGFYGIIIDKLDPFLDGNLVDFRIGPWEYERFNRELKEKIEKRQLEIKLIKHSYIEIDPV